MAIALANVGSGLSSGFQFLLAPLQAVVAFFAPWQSEMHSPSASSAVSSVAQPARAAPALRVVRVREEAAPISHAGRMVISGRMDDVCAELDRLARLESCEA